ncbi:winged helix-turn-helix domain-containing protein [Rheinheimera marina]|uniref:Winged helix-turn-helix domain-containing protein n=1 Tax=Rheinheimera marina TaxID=1774958 RepID=A0ABV9JHU6_9GAMM
MDYQIGAVRLCQRSAQLEKDGQWLHCEPKIYALLLYFCQQPDRAISRQELIDQVWQGRIVSDAAVNRAVAELRKLLEPEPKQPVYLRTVSKLGYQMTGVTPLTDSMSPEAELPAPKPSQQRSRVRWGLWGAVLPGLALLLALILLWPAKPPQYQLSDAEPLTRLAGESYKALAQGPQKLWFLHRAEPQEPLQLWLQQGTVAKAVTADSFLYLDFALIDEDTAVAVRWSNAEQRQCELVWLDLNTGQSQPLSPCPQASANQLAYAASSGWLYFNERPDISAPYALHALHLASGQRRQLTQPLAAGNGSGHYLFALSAAEDQLVLLEYQDGQQVLLKRLDAEGRVLQQLPLALMPTSVLWLQPEQLLLTTAQAVYLLSLTDGHLQLLKQEAGWSRFGLLESGKLLAERFDYLSQIESHSFSGQQLALYPQSAGRFSSPAVSPDGTLAFVAANSQGTQLFRQKQGMAAEPLPVPEPLQFVSALSWSPDGKALLLAANDTLFLWQQQSWQQLVKDSSVVHYAAFATDGAVLFSALQQGIWRLFRLEPGAAGPELLPPAEGYSVQGPDQQGFYYYTAFSKPGLFRWRPGQSAGLVLEDFPVHGWQNWQLQGQQLLAQYNGSWWLQPLGQGEPQRLTTEGRQCRLLAEQGLVCARNSHQQRQIWSLKLQPVE